MPSTIVGQVTKNSRTFVGGVDANNGGSKIVQLTVGGTREVGDRFNIRIGDYNYGYVAKPTGDVEFLLTFNKKLYATAETILHFSRLLNAREWDQEFAIGAGFINMLNEFTGGETLRALATYGNQLAIFARRTTQIWSMDVDPARNQQIQVLANVGALAAGSVIQIGDVDVFFLSDSGVRSLRSRDINNIAFSSDVGNPIDPLIIAKIQSVGDEVAQRAIGVVEPTDGRYWLALGDTIYVFSYFQSSKVAAWSTYKPTFTVDRFALKDGRVYVRGDDDKLYLYGGDDNNTYDDDDYRAANPLEVDLPFLSAGTPATQKEFTGLDCIVEGEFNIYLGTNPEMPDTRDLIATISAPSFDMRNIAVDAAGTHFSAKITKTKGGYGRISNIAVHYTSNESG